MIIRYESQQYGEITEQKQSAALYTAIFTIKHVAIQTDRQSCMIKQTDINCVTVSNYEAELDSQEM